MINRKAMLTQAIENGFDQTTEGYPDILTYCKEKNAYDYTIWGNTVTGKNLIPYPYAETTKTVNGVTFTDNGDGTITANGTATQSAYFVFRRDLKNIIDISKKYILSGSSDISVYIALYQDDIWKREFHSRNGNPIILDFPSYTDIEYNRILVTTYVPSGKTVNNAIVKPMLELGEVATEYEPYTESYVGDKTKNLIPYPYAITTQTTNGVTFTDNGDGTITVNGTATSNTYFILNDKLKNIIDISKKYILSGSSDISVYIALYQDDIWKREFHSRNGNPIILDFPSYTDIEYNRILVTTYVPSGKTVNNAIVKPMLELGEVATYYEPYGYKIPLVNGEEETVLYLPAPLGAGETVNSTEASLPPLPLHEGTNQITAATATPPAKIRVDYRARVKAEAYHAD